MGIGCVSQVSMVAVSGVTHESANVGSACVEHGEVFPVALGPVPYEAYAHIRAALADIHLDDHLTVEVHGTHMQTTMFTPGGVRWRPMFGVTATRA